MDATAAEIPMKTLCFCKNHVFLGLLHVFEAFDGKGFLSEKNYL